MIVDDKMLPIQYQLDKCKKWHAYIYVLNVNIAKLLNLIQTSTTITESMLW